MALTKRPTLFVAAVFVFVFVIIAICVLIAWIVLNHRYREANVKVDGVLTNKCGEQVRYYRLKDFLEYNKYSLDAAQAFQDAFKQERHELIKATTYDQANFVMFEHQNRIDDAIAKLKAPAGGLCFVFGLGGSDYMVSKSALAHIVRQSNGNDVAQRILPVSYVVSSEADMAALGRDLADPKLAREVYIMKKNVQRQEGQYITRDGNYIQNHAHDYVVIQRMLQDPYIVAGRKINMRVYMLVVVPAGAVAARFYAYNDGFMYYTPELWEAYSTEKAKIITTGYIDRKVYEENPLTHQDFKLLIGGVAYSKLERNIDYALGVLRKTYGEIFAQRNKTSGSGSVSFSIFGVDIAPDRELGCTIMEVNKGPDMGYKDERDKHVKLNMVRDALALVGLFGDERKGSLGNFREV